MDVLGSLTQTDLDNLIASGMVRGLRKSDRARGRKTYSFVQTIDDEYALFRCRQTGDCEVKRYKVKP